jgi:PRTRC genetic system ThiF family protein
MHTIIPYLLRSSIRVAVIGCGGTGGAILGGLPHLHHALLARGHRYGLAVTGFDGDRITEANCVRQPFSTSEIGLFKSVVLINRLNLFWGVEWKAEPEHVTKGRKISNQFDLVIGCVDTRAARFAIHDALTRRWCAIPYYLDIGNSANTGQFVLGQPLNRVNKHKAARLRTVAELFPEIVDSSLDEDSQPSCSAAEALLRQHEFINQTLANHALALLSRLFRGAALAYHGGFVNLASGSVVPLRTDSKVWKRLRRESRVA